MSIMYIIHRFVAVLLCSSCVTAIAYVPPLFNQKPCLTPIKAMLNNEKKPVFDRACYLRFKPALFHLAPGGGYDFSYRYKTYNDRVCCIRRVYVKYDQFAALPCERAVEFKKLVRVTWFEDSLYTTPIAIISSEGTGDIFKDNRKRIREDFKDRVDIEHEYGEEKLLLRNIKMNGTFFCLQDYEEELYAMPIIVEVDGMTPKLKIWDDQYYACKKVMAQTMNKCYAKYPKGMSLPVYTVAEKYGDLESKEADKESAEKHEACQEYLQYVYCVTREAIWKCPQSTVKGFIWTLFRNFQRICMYFFYDEYDQGCTLNYDHSKKECTVDDLAKLQKWHMPPDFNRVFQLDPTLWDEMHEYCTASVKWYYCLIEHIKKYYSDCEKKHVFPKLIHDRDKIIGRCFWTPHDFYFEYHPSLAQYDRYMDWMATQCKWAWAVSTHELCWKRYDVVYAEVDKVGTQLREDYSGTRDMDLINRVCCTLSRTRNCHVSSRPETCTEEQMLITYYRWGEQPEFGRCQAPFVYDCFR